MNSRKQLKSALESMMFVWGEPLEVSVCAEIFEMEKEEVADLFLELADEYEQEGRGIVIRRVNKGFQFVTRPENGMFIERLCRPVKVKRLSQSALEVLAIIAYKQPVTKGEIDAIRGIKCDRVVDGLMKKDLICVKGRSEGVGRPMLYGTTDTFLKQFGFATLKELPEIEDIEGIIGGGPEVSDDFRPEGAEDDGFEGGYDDGCEQIAIEGIDMGSPAQSDNEDDVDSPAQDDALDSVDTSARGGSTDEGDSPARDGSLDEADSPARREAPEQIEKE